jgi:predicted RNA-binding Zn ribbon-like protein
MRASLCVLLQELTSAALESEALHSRVDSPVHLVEAILKLRALPDSAVEIPLAGTNSQTREEFLILSLTAGASRTPVLSACKFAIESA